MKAKVPPQTRSFDGRNQFTLINNLELISGVSRNKNGTTTFFCSLDKDKNHKCWDQFLLGVHQSDIMKYMLVLSQDHSN